MQSTTPSQTTQWRLLGKSMMTQPWGNTVRAIRSQLYIGMLAPTGMNRNVTNCQAPCECAIALFPGLPRFCSSVCVQYKTQKRKNTKNREGLGTRLQIWLHTVSNMTLDVWLITVREKAWVILMTSCGQRVDIWGAAFDQYNSKTWHWSVPSVPKKKKKESCIDTPLWMVQPPVLG